VNATVGREYDVTDTSNVSCKVIDSARAADIFAANTFADY